MLDKPVYLWPFIIVYRFMKLITKLPIKFIQFFSLGFFFTMYFYISLIVSYITFQVKYFGLGVYAIFLIIKRIVKYFFSGIWATILGMFGIVKYFSYGVISPVLAIYNYNNTEVKKKKRMKVKVLAYEKKKKAEAIKIEQRNIAMQKQKEELEKKKVLFEAQRKIDIENKAKLLAKRMKEKDDLAAKKTREKADLIAKKKAKKQEKEDRILKKKNAKVDKEKFMEKNTYINENVKLEKKKFADYINSFLELFNNIPKKFKTYFTNYYNNLSFVKNQKNKTDISRQALLINFEGEYAERTDKKLVYEYVGKNLDGKLIKGYFEAFSKVEVHSFLLSEGFEVYSIKTSKMIQLFYGTGKGTRVKIKVKDLIFFLTQLSTYVKAGIPLVEALKILSRQYKNKSYQRIFRSMIYDLTMGENFSEALSKQGDAFPRLLVNMIKAAEMTGELPEALDDMAEYYTEADKTRKQMVTAMMYPSIIMVLALSVITFIMVFIVPKFVDIYASMDNATLPAITVFVVGASVFMEKNLIWLLVGLFFLIIIYRYLFKNVKLFKTMMQWLIMHVPGFGDIIIFNEVTMFTKTFASLLKHNVFITDSMEILNKITNNEIYKMIILDTITNLARGEKISLAFKDHWAVPVPAYEMIVTGERTGQLPEMMEKVSNYYQELHKQSVTRIKTFIEPVLIVFLTFMVGGIVLSIVIPMFGIYGTIK